jgi:hypothetical protein
MGLDMLSKDTPSWCRCKSWPSLGTWEIGDEAYGNLSISVPQIFILRCLYMRVEPNVKSGANVHEHQTSLWSQDSMGVLSMKVQLATGAHTVIPETLMFAISLSGLDRRHIC